MLCNIDNKEVNESSGIAPSYLQPGTYFTHNDSGDGPRFFRFDAKGHVLASYTVDVPNARDWEDIECARIKGTSTLFVGDIGDNKAKREHIKVYRMREPHGPSQKITQFDDLEIKFPDQAQNCEAMFVDPKTGDLWFVTKVMSGKSNVYTLPAPKASGKFTLVKVGQLEVGTAVPMSQVVTAGSCSPDGKFVILRTYTAIFEYRVGKSFRDWFKSEPARVEAPLESQGEGICYSADGKQILTTSEGSPCPVHRILIGR